MRANRKFSQYEGKDNPYERDLSRAISAHDDEDERILLRKELRKLKK